MTYLLSGYTSRFHKADSHGTKEHANRGKSGAARYADRGIVGGTSVFGAPAERQVGSMSQVAREYSAISKLERGRAKVGAEAISGARGARTAPRRTHGPRRGHHRAGLAFWDGHTGGGAPGKQVPARMRQMQALLAEIKEDKSPVVVAGDL
jgi:hypothetical protein